MQRITLAVIGCKSLANTSKFTPLLGNRAHLVSKHHQMSSSSSDATSQECLLKEASVPNKSWTEKTLKLYNELMDLCKDGKWEKVTSFQNFTGNERLFVRAIPAEGKMFEYAMFLNRSEERMRAVVQFGPWLQGPKGAVHGGAIATMFDSVSGVLTYQLGYRCVTVNLNVNFHGFLPLYTTAECTAWVTKKEGRKIFVESELRSVDGKTVFDRCSALWLRMGNSEDMVSKDMLPLNETAICEAWMAKKEGKKIYVEAKLQSADGKSIYDTCNSLWIDLNAHVITPQKDEQIQSKY